MPRYGKAQQTHWLNCKAREPLKNPVVPQHKDVLR